MHEPERTPEQAACDQAADRINAWLDSLPPAEADRILTDIRAKAREDALRIQELTE